MNEERKYLIYIHTSPSGKSYIGQTCNYKRRTTRHKCQTSGCNLFYKAIQKYGWDSFTHNILVEHLTLDEANIQEVELISKFNTLAPNGYNLNTGGKNAVPSKETREKMSKAKKGKIPHNKGKPMSEEQKQHLSKLNKGKSRPNHIKQKMIGKPNLHTSKCWIITNILTQEQYKVNNLPSWCKEHNVNYVNLLAVQKRQGICQKQWSIKLDDG
ncbi:MAG: hypothetical protein EO766_12130 [Hydrotalea sp. AMD]|uniref:NUMOD3 domain-containing DNA-binding protein n=1 Tax=Hydrotalea sp. AMD TaxID=2501297 RepID=UPI001027AD52|nr:NUMOD3 domain-containing DNA-binding protein [Hydrotalea sp. AMD]RWZ87266.1 MAG: hypothetical protein EO766_12130 [Hydrotalea sp. AMD]